MTKHAVRSLIAKGTLAEVGHLPILYSLEAMFTKLDAVAGADIDWKTIRLEALLREDDPPFELILTVSVETR